LTLGRYGRTSKHPLDLNHAVAAAVLQAGMGNTAGSTRRLSLESHPEPLTVLASEAHLVRAVNNLVRNALESSLEGSVTIRTERRQLDVSHTGYETIEPGDYAVVGVEDDGSGIGRDQLSRIFEPFFSTKCVGEQSGSGLGLAIVHSVVKEHEGFLDVTSEPGRGTTFTLYFPLAATIMLPVSPRPAIASGSARVLVLDDDPIQRRMAERVLLHLGYRVDIVASGQQAYELCDAAAAGPDPYDLIVFDVVLNEEVDGVELCERIRQRFPEQRGLLVSGHPPTKRAERAMAAGLGWLGKPYTAEALAAAVAAALRVPAPRKG
jgi:CheY-like chemotaxis protein/two-component sensor histidine kinase